MEKPVSKRKMKRLEAAEQVCRAFRKSLTYYAEKQHYQQIAYEWLLVWIKNSPKAVWGAVPAVPRKRVRGAEPKQA